MSLYGDYCKCLCFGNFIDPFTKFWGIFTSVVLCGVGVDIFVHHHTMGFYIILAAFVLFFLEVAWVITLFLKVCIREEYSPIFSCWNRILWVKDWRKTLVYFAFAFVLISKPHHLWLSWVAGIMLIILSILHFLHWWGVADGGYHKEALLDNQDDYCDRFDIEEIDNTMEVRNEIVKDISNNNEQNDQKFEI